MFLPLGWEYSQRILSSVDKAANYLREIIILSLQVIYDPLAKKKQTNKQKKKKKKRKEKLFGIK